MLQKTAFATTIASLAFCLIPIAVSAQETTVFPPDISKFVLKYQYHEKSGDKYEYYLPNEIGDHWTKLITVIRFANNAGHATLSDLEQISSSVISVAEKSVAEVTDLQDYPDTAHASSTRAFMITFSTAESDTAMLELDLEKYFLKDGYVWANLYAEQYRPSDARIFAQRRASLSMAIGAFVATPFPNPFAPKKQEAAVPPPKPLTIVAMTKINTPTSEILNLNNQLQSLLEQLIRALQTLVAMLPASNTSAGHVR